MLIDGIKLVEGSHVDNLTIASGDGFPSLPSTGELFYRTDSGTLFIYDGDWSPVAPESAEVTKAMIGLGNVDNTSDAAKPVSTAQRAALDLKSDITYVDSRVAALVDSSPATLDTLNELAAALGDDPNFATTTATAIGLRAPLASPTFTGTVGGITKAMVGLGNVDNTSDAAKPVSTAQLAALNLKANLTGAGTSGTWGISITGNAASATKLATARTINGVAFDGTENITIAKQQHYVGEVRAFAFSSIPEGWLICDGRSISTSAEALLFAKIGYTYGGSGGTFNLPNMLARTIRGAAAPGIGGGADSVMLGVSNLPDHNHPAIFNTAGFGPGATGPSPGSALGNSGTTGQGQAAIYVAGKTLDTVMDPASVTLGANPALAGEAFSIVPSHTDLVFCIAAGTEVDEANVQALVDAVNGAVAAIGDNISKSGGNFTGPVVFDAGASGNLNGNATSATAATTANTAGKLTTARKINGVDFDGSADINLPRQTPEYIHVQDRRPSGTPAQQIYVPGPSAVIDFARELGTALFNTIPGAARDGVDGISLPKGKYRASGNFTGVNSASSQVRLVNVTTNTDLGYSLTNVGAGGGGAAQGTTCPLNASFEIGEGGAVIKIMDRITSSSLAVEGYANFFLATNKFVEVYADLIIEKIG